AKRLAGDSGEEVERAAKQLLAEHRDEIDDSRLLERLEKLTQGPMEREASALLRQSADGGFPEMLRQFFVRYGDQVSDQMATTLFMHARLPLHQAEAALSEHPDDPALRRAYRAAIDTYLDRYG